MEDTDAIIDKLYDVKEAAFSEIHEVRTFRCYRQKKNGGTQAVTVEIKDAGYHLGPDLRYSVLAVSDEGTRAVGNPADTIQHALVLTHWNELDRPTK